MGAPRARIPLRSPRRPEPGRSAGPADPGLLGLREYRRKRDFAVTPEPRGHVQRAYRPGFRFVVQKHAARRLHYDLRLELDGVLKSWAVPRGPSYDPEHKRLAMQTEDHPIEYGDFEGIIPAGEYGGGTVLLWDRGIWTPLDEPRAALRAGRLRFKLEGEKLRGGWTLVKIRGRQARDAGKTWLLIKSPDETARPAAQLDVTASRPDSVATARTLEQIAKASDRVWHSMPPPAAVGVAPRHDGGRLRRPASIPAPAAAGDVVARLPGTRRGDLPRFVTPQLATLVSSPPAGDEWLHEMKFDGYRILSRIAGGQARLLSRNGKDWTAQFPAVAAAVAQLPVRQALLDGEVAVLRPDGTTSFNALQNVLEAGGGGELVYYVFDLLHQDGVDLREVPLESRKAALATLLGSGTGAVVRQSDHVVGGGAAFFRAACELGLEGMVSKRRDAAYVSGRGRTWLKVKCVNEQEFVVGGFTEPEGARVGIGALLLGVHEEDERLRYVGKVGTGFSAAAARALRKQLDGLVQERCPFSERPSGVGQPHWVRPVVVAQVMFTEWTPDGRLRHPSFKGLREDKDPRQIVREEPTPLRREPAGKESAMPATNEDGRDSRSPARAVTNGARSTRQARRRRPAVANRGAGPPPARPGGIQRSGASRVAGRSKASPRVRNGAEAEIAGVAITHPNRVVYPAQSITKLALARYYESIAEWILPHIRGRPTSLVRCPEGLQKACFYQKHVSGWAPEPLRRVRIREKHKVGEYLVVEDLPGLIGLVQMGILEIHTWNAVVDHLERPDRLVIDLDPDEAVPWSEVIAAARLVREEFARFGLESFVKTTGGKGLHVVVPIEPKLGWEDVAGFARSLAVEMARQDPGRFVTTMSKAARKGKIFIDYMRNLRGATSIAPYSTRARPGAPVSTPLAWDELDQKLRSDHFTVGNLRRRLAGLKVDPWKRYWMLRQQLRLASPTASGRRRPGR